MSTQVQVSGLDVPPVADPALQHLLAQIVQAIRVWSGDSRSPLDRVVTLRDLAEDTGALAVLQANSVSVQNSPLSQELGAGASSGGAAAAPVDTTPPPAPTALTASGAFETIVLSWSFDPAYSNLSHFEILRATTDNLSNAVIIGTSQSTVFSDPVGMAASYYYWVRAVSAANVVGPANATLGTFAETAFSPDEVRRQLTQNTWAASTFVRQYYVVAPSSPVTDATTGVPLVFQATNSGTTGTTEPVWPTAEGQTVTDGGVTWVAIVEGKAPFVIGQVNGNQTIAINGQLIVDQSITTPAIKVGAVTADRINVNNLAAISADLGAITAGSLNINGRFIVDTLGNTTILSSATGARLEIRNNVIKVFDINGVLRVKLGDLTA